eukprot:TRINITY_DN1348_c0_g1_i2.p1 TRINITY_DN1348_c0_g1~~TRINITY_DN1348_c0_g1_i2.p1  ORF type:complete len:280 (+),score=92.12 TRINITY_DN1348_c0_g1_i2:122-961(+)
MGERKVLNKYYPPDFDWRILPRAKGPKDHQFSVRMMMPMSVSCNTCGEYIYAGKKFNSKKEIVKGRKYLGIKIDRFYMHCPNCCKEFTILTDPENADYVCEHGVSRNFEPWRDAERKEAELEKEKVLTDDDVMKALEKRTEDSKMEMENLEAIEEMRSIAARAERLGAETLIGELEDKKLTWKEKQKLLEEEEEALVNKMFPKEVEIRVSEEERFAKPKKVEEPVFKKPEPKPTASLVVKKRTEPVKTDGEKKRKKKKIKTKVTTSGLGLGGLLGDDSD